jgi:hypothetical protein
MKSYLDELQESAEQELLYLLRHKDVQNFTLEITVDAGQWHIKICEHDSGHCGDGSGANFGQAWHDIVDPKIAVTR